MKLIQPLLLLSLIILFVCYFRWFRSAVFDKIIIALIFLMGILLVLFPDFTTRISVFLGVGRGTDLLLYTSIIFFSYILMLFYSKIKKMENRLVDLIRQQAISGAIYFPKTKEESENT